MLINRHRVRIEWADCDPAGIVYYPRYFAMFDTATHHLFEAAGWKKRDLLREFDIVGYPMVDTRARFILPSRFGDDIVIETRVAAIRNSSFDVEHRAFKPRSLADQIEADSAAGRGAAARFRRGPA